MIAVEVTVLPHPDSPTRPWISDSPTRQVHAAQRAGHRPVAVALEAHGEAADGEQGSGSHQPILIFGLSTL